MDFFIELFKRFTLKSPKFFQVLQTVGAVAAIITGIPSFLEGQGIAIPEALQKISSTVVAVAAGVLWVIAKLPVENPQAPEVNGRAVSKVKALPYSTKKAKRA